MTLRIFSEQLCGDEFITVLAVRSRVAGALELVICESRDIEREDVNQSFDS